MNSNKPGCFGSAITFKEGSTECSNCPFNVECKPLSEASIANLRAKLGIVVKKQASRTVIEVKQEEGPTVTSYLPKKVEALVAYVVNNKIDVRGSMLKGVNPFNPTPKWLFITCHLLLRIPGGVTEDILREAFEKKLNWTKDTAISYVAQARHLLTFLGVIDAIDGKFQMKANA